MLSGAYARLAIKVGAGPSGLVLALSLLQNGVSVRIIDKNPDIRAGQRGAGIMVSYVSSSRVSYLTAFFSHGQWSCLNSLASQNPSSTLVSLPLQ